MRKPIAASLALMMVMASAPAAQQEESGRSRTVGGLQNPSAPTQPPTRDFADLPMTLRPGTTVQVQRGSETLRGKVVEVSASGLELQADGRLVALPAKEISGVDVLRRETGRGAIIGALAGAGFLLAVTVIEKARCGEGCEDDSTVGIVAAATAFYAGIGAGAGALIGSRVHRRQPLYRAPGAAIRLDPRGGASIVYSVRF